MTPVMKAALLIVALSLSVEADWRDLIGKQVQLQPYLDSSLRVTFPTEDSVMSDNSTAWTTFTLVSPSLNGNPNAVTFAVDGNTSLVIHPGGTGAVQNRLLEAYGGFEEIASFSFEETLFGYILSVPCTVFGSDCADDTMYLYYDSTRSIAIAVFNRSQYTDQELSWGVISIEDSTTTSVPVVTSTTSAPTSSAAAPTTSAAAPTTSAAAPTTTAAAPTSSAAPAPYQPTVECFSSNVQVTVDMFSVTTIDNVDMYVGDNNSATECQATTNLLNLNFNFGLEECNPDISMTANDEVKFTYHIQHDNETTVGAISRTHVTGIDVWCLYPRTGVVDVRYTSNVTYARFIGGATGTFTFTMSLYTDSTFTTAYSSNAVMSVGTVVYADIRFDNPSSSLNMFVQECYATPSSNDTTYKYDFISSGGCFGADDTFAVVEANKGSKRYSFQFDAFRFTGLSTNEVYLTCNIYVCDSSEPAAGQCQHPMDCTAPLRRSLATDATYKISFGPVVIE